MTAGQAAAVGQAGKFTASAGDAQLIRVRIREVAPDTYASVGECEHCGALYTAVSGSKNGCWKLLRRKHRTHLPQCAGRE